MNLKKTASKFLQRVVSSRFCFLSCFCQVAQVPKPGSKSFFNAKLGIVKFDIPSEVLKKSICRVCGATIPRAMARLHYAYHAGKPWCYIHVSCAHRLEVDFLAEAVRFLQDRAPELTSEETKAEVAKAIFDMTTILKKH